mmetsp:Transcript_36355/g.71546  ORF Transcript_36355/g.71546 Transcript_36355/m.71546 type:complete len:112 (-) Transcript_36355:414-749(-)
MRGLGASEKRLAAAREGLDEWTDKPAGPVSLCRGWEADVLAVCRLIVCLNFGLFVCSFLLGHICGIDVFPWCIFLNASPFSPFPLNQYGVQKWTGEKREKGDRSCTQLRRG